MNRRENIKQYVRYFNNSYISIVNVFLFFNNRRYLYCVLITKIYVNTSDKQNFMI